jgi:hypothetical protein
VDAGGDCAHNDGVASTQENHSLNLSMVTLYRSHRIPTIGTNYVGGCRDGGVFGDGDVGSDESDVGLRVPLNLADREKWNSQDWPERSSAPSGMGNPWRLRLLPRM